MWSGASGTVSNRARRIRTRLSRAQFNELEVSIPTRSLADCITIMSEFEFSVHTGTLADVTTVQQINSHGGAAQGACDQAGAFRSVPYSADYVFLSAHK